MVPTLEPGLPRTLWHFLNRGVDGCFPSILLKATTPSLNNSARAVLLHDGIVQPKGLFPYWSNTILVYTPSYKLQDWWVKHRLTLQEHLHLRQLPLYMDPLLAVLNPNKWLSF